MRYLCAVEAAFRVAMNADEGYSGLMTKTPDHPTWRTLRGPRMTYELGELAEYVDLKKFIPKRKPEEIGLGRNVTIFDWLRLLAYKQVRLHKTPGCGIDGYNRWVSWCNLRALERNGDFSNPMDGREVWHVAKSVSKWVWREFDIAASDARFSKLQAHRGKKSGEARLAASEDKRASARLMAATGMSQRKIAEELGVSQGSVMNWLKGASPPPDPHPVQC